MRVLHVIPSISERSGGPGQAIIPMCAALIAESVEVLLATTDDGVSSFAFQVADSQSPTRQSSMTTQQLFEGVPTVMFPVQLGASFKYSRPFASWLDEHVTDYDVVHIHAVFNHSCIAAARACREKAVPYVVRPLGTLDPWSMNQKAWRKKLFWYGGIKSLLSSAAAIHYTARAEQNAAEQSLGLNHGIVIPLGVELQGEAKRASRKALAQKLPSLEDHLYVLVLSRLLPTKGIHVLLEAFLSLIKQDEFAQWRLVLAGEGSAEYLAKLKQSVAAADALDQVLFPGWLDGSQKKAALDNASLLALPSYHENFGLCVMEALGVGVPVLVSPYVNLADLIKAGGGGWVVATEAKAIQTLLASALGDPNELSRRGSAGKEIAQAFSWPRIAAQLNNLYDSILQSKHLPAPVSGEDKLKGPGI